VSRRAETRQKVFQARDLHGDEDHWNPVGFLGGVSWCCGVPTGICCGIPVELENILRDNRRNV